MSVFKMIVELKQQTPILHFQPDESGATLRASEVKPKLDRFLINQSDEAIPQDWFLKKSDNTTLVSKIDFGPIMEQIEKNEYSTFFVEKIIPILKKETRVSNRYSPWFYGKPKSPISRSSIRLFCGCLLCIELPYR